MTDANDKYKNTVFLPQTDFPMRGELPKKEPAMIEGWDQQDLYSQMRESQAGKTPWVLHDGPPYANGNIHMGHALNKILKDVIIKANIMNGKRSPYVPGWDCHGLPIEWKIEEKYRAEGKDKDAVDIIEFREECRNFARDWVAKQSAQFKRLGVSGDWDNPYLTMDFAAEAQIVREIHKFAANTLLYRGVKSVMWSVVEKTALAEAEVEYQEHKSVTIWARFPVVTAPSALLEGADIVIWTTTPWTMPSNRGIFFHNDITYNIYEVEEVEDGSKVEVGAKLVLAESLAEAVQTQGKISAMTSLGEIKGDELEGLVCAHPLRGQGYDYDVPAFHADYVTDSDGTGFVHVAPSHGPDDFILGVACGLEVTDNLADDGSFKEHVPLFAGMRIYDENGKMAEGNFAPIKAIDEAGKLLAKGSMRHEYPHSWRSKAPLIYRTTPQWFIAMDGTAESSNVTLREQALQAIAETDWHPAKGETRIRAMIENRPDWCISRQRAWGVPIALFVHKQSGEMLVDQDVFDRIASAFEEEGADAWWKDGAAERFLGASYNAEDYEQVFDIVDVWFESGSTHSFVLGNKDKWPDFNGVDQADMYLEGSDQHRGWFHSSLLESCGTKGRAPYDHVLTHGFVLDEKGYKMSKSLGNVVDPLKVMDEYGADILRLWVMTSDYSEDIRIGKDTLKNTGDLYRRIRNTLRFVLGAIDGYNQEAEGVDFDSKDVPELEKLTLHRLFEMDQALRGLIAAQDYGKMAKLIHDFCNEDLSAFYFDIRKDSLYCDGTADIRRRACRSVMVEIFRCLVTWLAPILAFTAEEAWSHRPAGVFEDAASVHLLEFPALPESWGNADLSAKWDVIKGVRKAVNEAIEPMRASKDLRSSLEAAPFVKLNGEQMDALTGLDLAEICITAPATLDEADALSVKISKAKGGKCARCWKILPEVTAEQLICQRCDHALDGSPTEEEAA